ncbi:MAG: hypothetical protein RLZZ628_668 [Bacteroidota bacterium]|jgi:DNA-directed RNA polymerase specialized sigma24 family protein
MCNCLDTAGRPAQNFALTRKAFCDLLQKLRSDNQEPMSRSLVKGNNYFKKCQFYLKTDYGLSDTDASDNATESLLALLKILKAGTHCYGRLQGLWRYIAHRKTINFLNRKKRQPNVVTDFTDLMQSHDLTMQDIENFEATFDTTEPKPQEVALDTALAYLKEKYPNYYDVLNLFYYELKEMPDNGRHQAIATALNITVATSTAHLARGKKKIIEYIDHHQSRFL